MGEDEEPLVGQTLDHGVGDVLGLDDALGPHRLQAQLVAAATGEHVGVHALGAQARHLDPLVAVGDRQPLGERRPHRAW